MQKLGHLILQKIEGDLQDLQTADALKDHFIEKKTASNKRRMGLDT